MMDTCSRDHIVDRCLALILRPVRCGAQIPPVIGFLLRIGQHSWFFAIPNICLPSAMDLEQKSGFVVNMVGSNGKRRCKKDVSIPPSDIRVDSY